MNTLVCRLCGKNCRQCDGYLKRVNQKGVDGIWECRPDCNTVIKADDAVIAAIDDKPAKEEVSVDVATELLTEIAEEDALIAAYRKVNSR